MRKKAVSAPKKKSVDFILLFSVLLLIGFGMIMMYSASWPYALHEFNDTGYFIKRQLMFGIIGMVTMFILSMIPYQKYSKIIVSIAFGFALFLNALTFTGMGVENLGSRRWLNLGFLFMPSDLLKPAAIIFLARFMSSKKKYIGGFPMTVFLLSAIAASFGIVILQKDLGTAMVIGTTLGGLILIGGVRISVILGGGAFLFGALLLLIRFNAERMRRLMVFRDPFQDKLGEGMQAARSLYAMGSGGLFGLGLGKSMLKFGYLPECYNDFIFAIISEELGLRGSLILLFLILSIVLRGFYISKNVKDSFGKFITAGFSLLIMIQSSVHILVNQSAIPTTGITLPFVSQGGTSLLIFMASVGVMLNVSRSVETKGEEA